jgi:hypothetical protein
MNIDDIEQKEEFNHYTNDFQIDFFQKILFQNKKKEEIIKEINKVFVHYHPFSTNSYMDFHY